MAVYFFYGDEDFNIEKEIDKLKKGLDKNFLEMSFKTYDNPKFPDLISVLRSQPLMFGKMLVVIKCLDYFTKTFDDKQIKEIESALENNNEKSVSNNGVAGFANNKFFMVIAILIFVGACVFLGYEAFTYFQAVK